MVLIFSCYLLHLIFETMRRQKFVIIFPYCNIECQCFCALSRARSGYLFDTAVIKTEQISKLLDFLDVNDLIRSTVFLRLIKRTKIQDCPIGYFCRQLIIPEFTAPRKTGISFLCDGCIIFIFFNLKKFPSKLIVSPLEIILKHVTYSLIRFSGCTNLIPCQFSARMGVHPIPIIVI